MSFLRFRAHAFALAFLLMLVALAGSAQADGRSLEVGPIFVEPRGDAYTHYATTAYVKEGTRYTGEAVPIEAYAWSAQVSCGSFQGSGPASSWDRQACNDPRQGQIVVSLAISWEGQTHYRYYTGGAADVEGQGAEGLVCKSDVRPSGSAMIRATQIVLPIEMRQGEPAMIIVWAENLGDAQGQRGITLIARHESAAGYTLEPPLSYSLPADSQAHRVTAWTPPLAGAWSFHADGVLATGRVAAPTSSAPAPQQDPGGPKLAVTKISTVSRAAYADDPSTLVLVRVDNTGNEEGSGSFTLDARLVGAPLDRVAEFDVTVPAGSWREVTLQWDPDAAGTWELVSGGLVQPMTVYEGASSGPFSSYDPGHQSGSQITVIHVGDVPDSYRTDDPRTKVPITLWNEGNDEGTVEFDVIGHAQNGSVHTLGHLKVTVPGKSRLVAHVDRPTDGGRWEIEAQGVRGVVNNLADDGYARLLDAVSLQGCPGPTLASGPPPPSYPLGPVIPTMTSSAGSGEIPAIPIDTNPGGSGTPTVAPQESPGPGLLLALVALAAVALLGSRRR